jgi:hypothetical protein
MTTMPAVGHMVVVRSVDVAYWTYADILRSVVMATATDTGSH